MANKNVNISFYQFTFDKSIPTGPNSSTSSTLTKEESVIFFNKIYEKMKILSNGHRVSEIFEKDFVVEFIKYDNNVLFAKFGKHNSSNTIEIRDRSTLSSEPVQMTDTQRLELFTYFIADFNTRIISYMNIFIAPHISFLKKFFDSFGIAENTFFNTSIILDKNMLNNIIKKGFVSKIDISFAVPNDDILSKEFEISKSTFASLDNVRTRRVSYTITAEKNQNLFRDANAIGTFLNEVNRKAKSISKFTLNAKNENEKTQSYDLIASKFTKNVDLGAPNITQLKEDDFYDLLFNSYNSHKQELISLIQG